MCRPTVRWRRTPAGPRHPTPPRRRGTPRRGRGRRRSARSRSAGPSSPTGPAPGGGEVHPRAARCRRGVRDGPRSGARPRARWPSSVQGCGSLPRRCSGSSPVRTQARRASWCRALSIFVYSRNESSPGAIVGGLTIRSCSSTQTTDGTLVMSYLSAVTCAVSTTTGYDGAGGLDPRPGVLGVAVERDREQPAGRSRPSSCCSRLPSARARAAPAPRRPGHQHPLVAGEVVEAESGVPSTSGRVSDGARPSPAARRGSSADGTSAATSSSAASTQQQPEGLRPRPRRSIRPGSSGDGDDAAEQRHADLAAAQALGLELPAGGRGQVGGGDGAALDGELRAPRRRRRSGSAPAHRRHETGTGSRWSRGSAVAGVDQADLPAHVVHLAA